MSDADVVLFSGMYDDMTESPEDYQSLLTEMRVRGTPMICPNPDRTVMVGDQIIYCAGAVAELYETMGGQVIWMGKPYPVVYERARTRLAEMTGMPHRGCWRLATGRRPIYRAPPRRALTPCLLPVGWPERPARHLIRPKTLPLCWPKKTRKPPMPCVTLSGNLSHPTTRPRLSS